MLSPIMKDMPLLDTLKRSYTCDQKTYGLALGNSIKRGSTVYTLMEPYRKLSQIINSFSLMSGGLRKYVNSIITILHARTEDVSFGVSALPPGTLRGSI